MLEFFSKHKGTSGVISIMLTLLLLPIYSLAALLMEASRIRSAQEQLNELNAIGCMAVLADYISYLETDFGLYAMDTSDWTDDISSNTFNEYLEFCESNGGADTLSLNKLFGVDEANCSIEGMYTLADPEVLKLQITQYGKFTLPATSICELTLDKLLEKVKGFFDGITDKIEDVSEIAEAGNSIGEFSLTADEFIEKIEALPGKSSDVSTALNEFKGAIPDPSDKAASYVANSNYINKYFSDPSTWNSKLNALKNLITSQRSDWKNNYFDISDKSKTFTLTSDEVGYMDTWGYDYDTTTTYSYSTWIDWVESDLLSQLYSSGSDWNMEDDTDVGNVLDKIDIAIDVTSFYTSLKSCSAESKYEDLKDAAEEFKSAYEDYVSAYEDFFDALKDLGDALNTALENLEDISDSEETGLEFTEFEDQSTAISSLMSDELKEHHQSQQQAVQDKYNKIKNLSPDVDSSDWIDDFVDISKGNRDNDFLFVLDEKAMISQFTDYLSGDPYHEHFQYLSGSAVSEAIAIFTEEKLVEGDGGLNDIIHFYEIIVDMMFSSMPSDPRLNNEVNLDDVPSKNAIDSRFLDPSANESSDKSFVSNELATIDSYATKYNYDYGYDMPDFDTDGGEPSALITAIENFQDDKEKLEEDIEKLGSGIWELGLIDFLETVADVLTDIINLCEDVIEIVAQIVIVIGELIANAAGQAYANYLITEYAAQKFDNRVDVDKSLYQVSDTLDTTEQRKFDGAELEYLLIGSNSEELNQLGVYGIIYAIRTIFNIIAVCADTDIMEIAGSTTLAAPVVIIIWVLAENAVNMIFLLNGLEVPLISMDEGGRIHAITCPVALLSNLDDALTEIEDDLAEKAEENDQVAYSNLIKQAIEGLMFDNLCPMSYKGYCWFMLMLYPQNIKLLRIADLLQMHGREELGDSSFKLTNAKTYIRTELKASYDPLLPIISMSDQSLDFLKFRSLQYNGY